MPFLNISDSDGVVTLTMSQPATRNALSENSAVDEFREACARINADRAAKVVIITGEGPVFSSGGNLATMDRYLEDSWSALAISEDYRSGIQQLPLAVHRLEVPSIACVNGPAIGAGCDLACMCDIRIASETASFAESFVRLGIVPGDGGAWFLQRLVGPSKAAEMSFTGEAIGASEALACGLVSQVVPAGQLMAEGQRLARKIAANSGPALRLGKRLLREGRQQPLESVLELSASYQAMLHKTPEHRQAVRDFLAAREAARANKHRQA